MGTVIKELVTQGHELVALLGTQHGMHDAASLVQRLTAQLDITAVALREMTKKRDAEHGDVLTWEKTMFKVCGEDGPKSVAAKFAELEAKCAALAAELKQSQIDACCYKKGMEASNERLVQVAAELSAVEAIHNEAVFITDAHYEQCPKEVQKIIRSLAVMQIPAYKAFLAEVRAQGVDGAAGAIMVHMNHQHPAVAEALHILLIHAAQLRQEAAQ